MKSDFHEREKILLRAAQPLGRARLDKWLRKRGFRSEDEFYYLQREDRVEPWQTSTVVTLNVRRSGGDVYETEEDLADGNGTNWDELAADFYLASLPREFITTLVREIEALAIEFDLSVDYNGESIDPVELSKRLNGIADQLSIEWDAPGSEALAILIEQQYGSP